MILKVVALASAVFLGGCATADRQLQRFEYSRPQMGVPFQIVLYAHDKVSADAVADAAFARISELNAVMSDFDTDSELVRLSQTAGQGRAVRVSDDLWCVLVHAQRLARESGGAFDITCGPVVSLWRKARREKKLPDPAKLADALKAVGFDKLRLDPTDRTAELLVPYMRLDLGAIAKGFAIDEALKVLRSRGTSRALVSGGGDMAAGDLPPGKEGWRIELAPLDATNAVGSKFVLLKNRALATSGDIFQYVEIDGVRYSHIVDPRTGVGLTDRSMVVVIARDCMTADSLSTCASVLGPDKALPFVEQRGACARIVRKPRDQVEVRESKCFRRALERRAPPRQG